MNIIIVYGSLLGKTERIAYLIGHVLQSKGANVVVKNVRKATTQELTAYDLIILGSSTWDDGQLQFDFRPFHAELMKTDMQGKNFAVFVLGSHKYPHPFYAADIIEKTVQHIGGNLIQETIKLDIDHDDPEDKKDKEVIEWASRFIV